MRIKLLIFVIILSSGANALLAQPVFLHKSHFFDSFNLIKDSAIYFNSHVKSMTKWNHYANRPDSVFERQIRCFDTLGRETSSTSLLGDGRLSYTDTTQYNKDFSAIIRTIWENNATVTNTVVMNTQLQRDQWGRVTNLVIFVNESKYLEISFKYSDDPSTITILSESPLKPSIDTEPQIFYYNEYGFLKEIVYSQKNGSYFKYSYSGDGFIISVYMNDTLSSKSSSLFDSNGNIIQIKSLLKNGKSLITDNFVFNNGKLLAEETLDHDGKIKFKYIYKYNERGLVLQKSNEYDEPEFYTYEYYK